MNESDNKVGMPFAKQKLTLGVAALGLVGLVSWAGWTAFQGSSSPSVSPVASAFAAGDSSGQSDRQVASINGMKITEMELGGMLQSGVDRAIVIDRYINKVVAAERGREMYVEEAKAALRAAEREVLSTLYTTKRMDELRKAVSDDDVKAYYDANVLDQNFQQWKVSYYLSNDQNDVQQTLDKLRKGDKDALDQLKPLVEQGDGYSVAQAMPYNLGRVVSKMKKGEFSEVLRLRNGLLVLKIEDSKQLKKPTLEELKQDIVQALALEKFNAELEQARRQAKVELG
ncbi:peptidylprolyl isomerase [Limnobacter profundi]|jgi:peptidyl-prolyl cis-trans isomerase C|uniref:peptidylprolyl isomerase n=1 Tax=Limnobacter profundi TaxID=2732163 RepID=A0ABX6N835_9BURK|nr:peptidylprolyl isomerase [Limnobacter sp. SAORIC-580]QJR30596.1 peptidyl-prolyl cis-trans isomerase [Limnobacter sp. SAORIC-580]